MIESLSSTIRKNSDSLTIDATLSGQLSHYAKKLCMANKTVLSLRKINKLKTTPCKIHSIIIFSTKTQGEHKNIEVQFHNVMHLILIPGITSHYFVLK